MTIIALVLSILVGAASLAIGYGRAGATTYSLGFLLLAAAWLFALFRKWYWFAFPWPADHHRCRSLWRLAGVADRVDAAGRGRRLARLGSV